MGVSFGNSGVFSEVDTQEAEAVNPYQFDESQRFNEEEETEFDTEVVNYLSSGKVFCGRNAEFLQTAYFEIINGDNKDPKFWSDFTSSFQELIDISIDDFANASRIATNDIISAYRVMKSGNDVLREGRIKYAVSMLFRSCISIENVRYIDSASVVRQLRAA